MYRQKHLLDFTCQFCTDGADLRSGLIHQIRNSGLKNKICSSSKRYERTAASCESSQGSSTFECRLDELDAIVLLWKLTSVSISSSSSSSCPSSYSSKTKTTLAEDCADCNGLLAKLLRMPPLPAPTCVSNPGTERLLVPIEPPVLADPLRRSRFDKYSL